MTASVLQSVKHKQLSDLEARESSAAFALVARANEMDARALKRTLCALGLRTTSSEARAFVYEFDYNSTHTIGLVDFQRIYLFKTLQRSRTQLFHDAFDALDASRTDSIYLDDLVCTSTTSSAESTAGVNATAFVRCAALQHYDDADASAVERFVCDATAAAEQHSVDTIRITRDALAAVLRIEIE